MSTDSLPSPAKRAFDAQLEWMMAEDTIHDAVAAILHGQPWWEVHWGYCHVLDHYDSSFETINVPDDFVLTEAQAEALRALGFDRWWLHYRDGTESYCLSSDRKPSKFAGAAEPDEIIQARAGLAKAVRERDALAARIEALAAKLAEDPLRFSASDLATDLRALLAEEARQGDA